MCSEDIHFSPQTSACEQTACAHVPANPSLPALSLRHKGASVQITLSLTMTLEHSKSYCIQGELMKINLLSWEERHLKKLTAIWSYVLKGW